MDILTTECDKDFIVSPKKSKDFLEHKRKDNPNKKLLLKITDKIKDKND